jgi:membrane associated rhomboid family serine protease
MYLLRQRICCRQLFSPSNPSRNCRYVPSPINTFQTTGVICLQFRLKSSNRKKQRLHQQPQSSHPVLPSPQQQNTRPQAPPKPRRSRPVDPITPSRTLPIINQVYRKQTPAAEFFADLRNWRYSAWFLTILVNSTTFVIFIFWAREAFHAKELKDAKMAEEDKLGVDKLGEKNEDGKYVVGTIQDTRYVTPGQEWLLDNFTVTPINLREGRYWTLFTSLFSHQLPAHAAINMIAAHYLFKNLCPAYGTVPVGVTFLVGGIVGNLLICLWMGKRGGHVYDEKFPGQFFGGLGMSGATLSLLGFGCAVHPKWVVKIYGVIPINASYILIAAWFYEAFQYWRQTGWDKIQSSVLIYCNCWLTVA